jgi:hypothetical protein
MRACSFVLLLLAAHPHNFPWSHPAPCAGKPEAVAQPASKAAVVGAVAGGVVGGVVFLTLVVLGGMYVRWRRVHMRVQAELHKKSTSPNGSVSDDPCAGGKALDAAAAAEAGAAGAAEAGRTSSGGSGPRRTSSGGSGSGSGARRAGSGSGSGSAGSGELARVRAFVSDLTGRRTSSGGTATLATDLSKFGAEFNISEPAPRSGVVVHSAAAAACTMPCRAPARALPAPSPAPPCRAAPRPPSTRCAREPRPAPSADRSLCAPRAVNFADLELLKPIGEGSFGLVYMARYLQTTVAVKMLTMDAKHGVAGTASRPAPPSAAAMAALQREASIMASLRHPNCVQYIAACLDPPALVMEHCPRKSVDCLLALAGADPKVRGGERRGAARRRGSAPAHHRGCPVLTQPCSAVCPRLAPVRPHAFHGRGAPCHGLNWYWFWCCHWCWRRH